MAKNFLNKDVHTAATERLDFIFSEFERVYVAFSAGKDSGVLLNLAIEAARRAGKLPLDVLLVDFEAQYKHTVDFAMRMLSKPEVRAHWVCLPIHLRNAVSQFQSHWLCWDPDKKDSWVRQLPDHPGVINDERHFPFFKRGMEFEEFVPLFADWLSGGKKTCCLIGIRADESLNRFRTLRNQKKDPYLGRMWTTRLTGSNLVNQHLYNGYPIYDWGVEDLWAANGKYAFDYNKIYDLMHWAGLSLPQMRLCQPYGDDQRKGLFLFKILEPETWSRVVNRVEGANFGNRYSEHDQQALGNVKLVLPAGHTYNTYGEFLLENMPPHTAAHFRKHVGAFLRGSQEMGIKPNWHMICKVLLKNDHNCKGLSCAQAQQTVERKRNLVAKYKSL